MSITPLDQNHSDHQQPSCPLCGLPMLLTEIEGAATRAAEKLHFECKACDARAIIPHLD